VSPLSEEIKWPNGFMCPQCGQNNGIDLHCRELTECSHCHKQTSVMSGTLFHGSNLPFLKWFWALYFIGSDIGSISALRLSKLIKVNWRKGQFIVNESKSGYGTQEQPLPTVGHNKVR
jgi:hypothetical protein